MSDSLSSSLHNSINAPLINVKNWQKRVLRIQDELVGKSLNRDMNAGIFLDKSNVLLIGIHISVCTDY